MIKFESVIHNVRCSGSLRKNPIFGWDCSIKDLRTRLSSISNIEMLGSCRQNGFQQRNSGRYTGAIVQTAKTMGGKDRPWVPFAVGVFTHVSKEQESIFCSKDHIHHSHPLLRWRCVICLALPRTFRLLFFSKFGHIFPIYCTVHFPSHPSFFFNIFPLLNLLFSIFFLPNAVI